MKLHRLGIQNFRPIQDLSLGFEDGLGRVRPVTVLAGPNGCGKTSVLYGIVQALRGPTGYRADDVPQPNDEDVHRAGGAGGLVSKPTSISVKLELEFEEVERDAIPKVFNDTKDIRAAKDPSLGSIPDGRVTVKWEYPPHRKADGTLWPPWYCTCEPQGGLAWLRGRQYAIRAWKRRKLSDVSLLDDIGTLFIFPQDRSLMRRVLGEKRGTDDRDDESVASSERGPSEEDVLSPAFVLESAERQTPRQSLWDILAYLGQYANQRDVPLPDKLNWEKRVKASFARICAPKEYLGFKYPVNSPIGAPWLRDGGYTYPLDKAASGEQVVLDYVTRLTYPSPINHGLVLIDEPELHLHPGWVRQLYRALPQIGVGNQYILTTHSAEMRQMAAEDNALVDLGELNGGQ
jgi:energy-coupling factor transporter ATP-binding protein EcfA2